ncbi:methyltransferase domain-containing protein [Pseudomonas sp. PDM31]|nr:methyltransferase domain-containing protein [Pseudomonas sp. PDM31]
MDIPYRPFPLYISTHKPHFVLKGRFPVHEAASKIIDLYERHAQTWDRIRSRLGTEHSWLERFRRVMPDADGQVLDLGCGCAEPMASYLIDAGHAVCGIDSSESMIEFCQQRFPGQDWRVADMRRMDLGQRYAGILAWDSFFHLTPEDQRRMFPIFQAHAQPGAALMFTSGTAHGIALGTFEGETLYHASLDHGEYVDLLNRHGFRVVEQLTEDPLCGGHTVWLAVFE